MTSYSKLSLILVLIPLALSACSPGYVMRAAYEESKILLRRQRIDDLLADPNTDQNTKVKLQVVKDAREFANLIGLDVGNSFTRYSKVNRDVLAWVVVASKPDSFTLYTWWFPFVGTVPYKGFFDKEDAKEALGELIKEGYESWVRGTEAISTLGWFNDPILSTTLAHDEFEIANTVLHESTHRTVWFADNVNFNESLANFCGHQANVLFYEDKLSKCAGEADCVIAYTQKLMKSQELLERELSIGDNVQRLHSRLSELYSSNKTKEQKLEERKVIFYEETKELRAKYPELKVLKSVNNAELMQLKLYLTDLRKFQQLFLKEGENFKAFLEEIRKIRDNIKDKYEADPFSYLSGAL